ncbi:MAG: hypothetical protein CK429_35010 [Mycobacterium sp.]|uniref:hypothetical protein n=1 Tax=Mycobacterium sp. TaxID=1785 RepID=UPI000CBD43AF|nr:hypothetical protein [Mycobacterium sp.]PJE02192.1 MAG: hypothetical protein CK429_35010 [Mycobacterium sp.]PJE05687.1 MAG: hypothetical protein CK428_26010 [Mycobacterium sp.]PJE24353.1 MAG: hypothetical protein CK431_06535 [Mycobacterium sp.]
MNTDTDWHTTHQQVLDFAHVLTAAGALRSAAEAIEYFEKPSSFTSERNLWIRSGRPRPPSSDDLAEARSLGDASPRAVALRQQHHAAHAAWYAFCATLDEFHHTGRPVRLI